MKRLLLTLALVCGILVGPLAFQVQAAPSRLPDLVIDSYYLRTGGPPFIDTRTFTADECAVQEGYASAGTHRLLRFHTVVANVGTRDLVLGKPQANDSDWTFSPCHQHWHFVPFAEYRLFDASGVEVGIGHKQSFCVEDGNPVVIDPSRPRFTCDRQGLSVGWEDAYFANLSGQWIVIDDVPAGNYTLSIEVNYAGALIESDYANNVSSVQVTISAP